MKTILLLGALSAMIVGAGAAFAPEQTAVFVALAAVLNLGAYFFSDRLVLALHHARQVTRREAPELHALVDELAGRAGIPKPRVAISDDPQPNAFATGRNPSHGVVAVTTGILDLLDPRELRAVLAHEIGHIRNRDILVSTIAAALASAVTYLANAVTFGAMFSRGDEEEPGGASGLGSLLVLLLAPIGATLVQLGISRSREFLADQLGAEISGDPAALANALLKLDRAAHVVPSWADQPATANLFIVNPLAARGNTMLRLFSTHPPVEARVDRLMAMANNRFSARRRRALLAL